MPPRPTLRCYQASQRHANAPVEAVWVTDDILGLAYQRYIRVSRTQTRTVSYAPGPLYHRKRFGKRQMTELNSFQSVGSLPAWALPNAPDMTEWQWQPPKPELWSPWPSPSPPPPPPPAQSIPEVAPLPEPEAELQPRLQSDFCKVAILEKPRASNTWKSLHNLLYHLRTHHDNSTEQPYETNFWAFMEAFECALSEGRLSGPATADVFITAVKDTLLTEKRFPSLARNLRRHLMSHLAEGVKSARKADRSFLIPSSRFWEFYMGHIAQQKADLFSADLFAFAMVHLQTRHRRLNYDIILQTLNHFFHLWRGAELPGEPDDVDWPEISRTFCQATMWIERINQASWNVEVLLANGKIQEARIQLAFAKSGFAEAQRFTLKMASLMSDDSAMAAKIAIGLKVLFPRNDRILYAKATILVGKPTNNWSRAHYNWLQVMAQLPKIPSNRFRRLLDLFPPRGHGALSETDLCHLLLLHWESRDKLHFDRPARHVWNSSRGDDNRIVLAALALAVNKTTSPKTCVAIFWELWAIIRAREGLGVFLQQLDLLAQDEVLSNGFLQRLAWASNDHRIALQIHSILVRQSGRKINFWWPPFWEKFAARLAHRKDHMVDPIEFAKKLLFPDSNSRPFQPGPSRIVERHYHENLNKVDLEPLNAQVAPYQSSTPLDQEMNEDVATRSRHQQQVERLKASLRLLGEARKMSDRKAFRAVTRFTVRLAKKQGFLTARDLATLTSVIMRPLDKGVCGSKERFKWYLGVVYRFLGEDACIQVGLLLKRRRAENWVAWQRRLNRAVRIARENQGMGMTFPVTKDEDRFRNLPKDTRSEKIGHDEGTDTTLQVMADEDPFHVLLKDTQPEKIGQNEGMTTNLQVTKDEDPFRNLLKDIQPENIGQDVSF